MTGKTKHATERPRAWEQGHNAGRHGLVRGANPYPTGSNDARLWTAGYLEGVAEMQKAVGK